MLKESIFKFYASLKRTEQFQKDGRVVKSPIKEEDLLIDIYSLNDQETDTVRLDASTIKQLFEETDYNLDDVRKNKFPLKEHTF